MLASIPARLSICLDAKVAGHGIGVDEAIAALFALPRRCYPAHAWLALHDNRHEARCGHLLELVGTHQRLGDVNVARARLSVIANLLKKGTDLRVVQVFAGHKWASTTGRYRQSEAEALKSALLKHHPFA